MICPANNGDMLSKGAAAGDTQTHCVPTTRQSNSRRGPYPGSRPLNLDRLLGGLGIGVIPIWLFNGDEISRGEVRIILRDFEPTSLPIHAVYPSRRLVPTKVRAMIEFLASEFGLDPLLSDRSLGHAALSDARTLAHGSG